jgi:3-hydroxybutyryl-CoA dehydrogenase
MARDIRRIGVIGAGTMGNGIAQAFAAAGYPVVLRDIAQPALDHGMATVKSSFGRLVAREKITQGDADAAFQKITPTIAI